MKRDLYTLLQGTYDHNSPLKKLHGHRDIFNKIALETDKLYGEHINATDNAFTTLYARRSMYNKNFHYGLVRFPQPKNININMMPINVWDLEGTLPTELGEYKAMIASCCYVHHQINPDGTSSPITDYSSYVAYLTIHESDVDPGKTHRRPGLHIERPNIITSPETRLVKRPSKERLDALLLQVPSAEEMTYLNLSWSLGSRIDGIPVDGIYMSSTVDDSCAIYPALIERPHEITDANGGCECLRDRLPQPTLTKANKLYWITDRTPYESLPLPHGGYRQFFRLVVGPVSTWYAKHNTPNPLCEPGVPISYADKFMVT